MVMAKSHEYLMEQAYMKLRTGILDEAMVRQVVSEVVPGKAKRVNRTIKPDREPQPYTAKKKKTLLSMMIKNYTADKQVEWTDKTKMEVAGVFKVLLCMLGDIDVCSITKPMVVELRSNLLKLPPNVFKKYPGKSIKEILAIDSITPMSIKSVNKHIARLGALLRYCTDENVISKNTASGLKISQKKKVSEERSAYSTEDIGKIVGSLPNDSKRPERFWIPLIGLYSGMRLNEICQLFVEDIQQIDGIWCFNINDAGDKRLKNVASERVVPIHPYLLKLGLLEYVRSLEATKILRLWMSLTWTRINGYGNSFCNWFQRFNREYVTGDPLKVFHSMRHTVADTLKQAAIPEVVISEIMGHAHNSITTGRYGKRYQPKVLLEALMKLGYGIDLQK
jgi:integrase